MRKTYRAHGGTRQYWEDRWDRIPADDGELNLDRYPGKFAEEAIALGGAPILEAGCGAGRVLIHYYRAGHQIIGMDYVEGAIDKIQQLEPGIDAFAGDIRKLPYEDGKFSVLLAFGLYHGLEEGIEEALQETRRVLRDGGVLCASMRADNLQNRIVDWLAARKFAPGVEKKFHKANYTRSEFVKLLEGAGFDVDSVRYVENMPFLYKFKIFRSSQQAVFDEHAARGEGYRLSPLGNALQKLLFGLFPGAFCNINVAIARAR
jgi:SAM-dependent methyltransferase